MSEDAKPKEKQNALEWVAMLLGIALFGGFIVALVREVLRPDVSPTFTAKIRAPYRSGGNWLLPVSITNHGTTGAAAVDVIGKAGEEESTASIEQLPAGSSVNLLLGFEKEPQKPEVRVGGAELP